MLFIKQKKFFIALITVITVVPVLTACSESSSESKSDVGYRYWGYSQSNDGSTWFTAGEGPATADPQDGTVEGWNYTFSADGIVDAQAPSTAPDFQSLCASMPAKDGKKRVGYVIEFGDPVIYPEGDTAPEKVSGCASLPLNATGIDLLNVVAKVRAGEGGFICGLNGFPAKDCGEEPIPVPDSLRK